MITGTNTTNSLPWGSGVFVRGVALTDAGTTTMFVPGPGQRVVSPLTLHVVKTGERLDFIGGTFGSSLLETQLQILADVTLGEQLTAAMIARRLRFGTFLYDDLNSNTQAHVEANWLDGDAPDDLAQELERRGLLVKRYPYGPTSWGAFAVRGPSGTLAAATFDASWFRGSVTELAK